MQSYPGGTGGISIKGGKTYAILTTRKGNQREQRQAPYVVYGVPGMDLPIEDIDRVLKDLRELIDGIDDWLSSLADELPISIDILSTTEVTFKPK